MSLAFGVLTPASGEGRHRAHRRAEKVRVEIEDFAFHPHALRVRRGAKVVFANRDRLAHTATRRGSFNTGRIQPGHSMAVRFARRGVYAFHCTIHPFMHGKIVVR
ncbi:MAG TPA: cupredoxin domain-containing protein [Solirubrobacterales bacterium]|nr:cupredoxin domain-containing protein [Solirubrobacterales bacterium]